MTENKYSFKIQTSQDIISIPLIEGQALFVLGANGVGKSTLMHKLFQQNSNHTKRILAHRQTWFTDNAMNMTARDKKSTEQYMKDRDSHFSSRWKDESSASRSSVTIFDLINSENIRARNITREVDNDNLELAKKLSNIQSPLESINELLALSNIPIFITLEKDEQLFASKNGGEKYSIAELSDGERNALLICADVLTTEPNQLIILDEPERHLHRSIISPLLSSLFQKRKDCVFVISTHDVFLPLDHSDANVLLLRSCEWTGNQIKNWDADLIPNSDEIPISVKKEILGSKRNILFVEGEYESLDKQIYQLIFSDITVIPQGNCSQVEKAVEGIRGTSKLHWINAYGLIDADDRIQEQISELNTKGIAALVCYSVESLYYNLDIIEKISNKVAELTGQNASTLYRKTIAEVIPNILPHKQRLCSRLCEKQIRNKIMSELPKHKDIQEKREISFNINIKESMENEEKLFDKLVAEKDLNGLINRYPIRETPILNKIASSLGLNCERYESSVRKLIVDDDETKKFYRSLLFPLTNLMNNQ